MKRVPVDQVDQEMTLAREVRGRSGNVLLQKGATLTPFTARRLKNWDITFIYVEGEAEDEQPHNAVKVSPDEITGLLEKKFADVAGHPIMKKIFVAATQHRIKRGS